MIVSGVFYYNCCLIFFSLVFHLIYVVGDKRWVFSQNK